MFQDEGFKLETFIKKNVESVMQDTEEDRKFDEDRKQRKTEHLEPKLIFGLYYPSQTPVI